MLGHILLSQRTSGSSKYVWLPFFFLVAVFHLETAFAEFATEKIENVLCLDLLTPIVKYLIST